VCNLSELTEGEGYEVWVNGRPLALFLHNSKVFALEDRCPHREGQLSRGRLVNGEAVCPLHGWNFDLATGISPYTPTDRVGTYPARVSGEAVEVDAEAVPPLPATAFDGYQGRWKRWNQDTRGKLEIRKLARGKGPEVAAMGAEPPVPGALPGPDHFHLLAAQLARLPKLKSDAVNTSVTIGRGVLQPLQLSLPAYVSHMSFGALSKQAKMALAKGSALADTMIGSGEGGMLPEERALARRYILEMASGYFGWETENMARADAFEIKFGQSAKPGLGGELPAHKVTEEIARVRGLAPGSAAISPSRFTDLDTVEAVSERIGSLREQFPTKPIGIKLAANHVEQDLKAALSLGPDFITLDGFGGGTGAAPVYVRDHVGLPLVMALPIARRLIDEHNARTNRPVSLLAAGGIRTPADIIKIIALGADACALATASLFALGCEYYRACHTNRCPTGVATQDERLAGRIDVDTGAERVANFFNATREMISGYLRMMGYVDLSDITHDDLVALTADARHILARY